ncbi:MAG: fructosamine kinase family protein [Cyanobacteriota bacterium]|jgi:fructosamine-3-kinase
MIWQTISEDISRLTGEIFTLSEKRPVSGGCINQGYRVLDGGRSYFVKLNSAEKLPMFEAEALGLTVMEATQTIRVPRPLGTGTGAGQSYLILEWLDFSAGDSAAWAEMGRNLARLHQTGRAERFGWERHNTIGSTLQINDWKDDWTDFWLDNRLGYQLDLARKRGGGFPSLAEITPAVNAILENHHPAPSLVHGDLWSGNAAILVTGEPVILDPAVYYGDPEVDLAMTELFGGFPGAFYRGYGEICPPQPGYEKRKILYNLYHILNHFNLFGGGYAQQAQGMLRRLGAG